MKSDSVERIDTRKAILAAAGGLFAAMGYDRTSVREIAEKAGVAKPMIYYYFHSKQGLLEEVLDSAFSPLVERLAAINAREASADAAECLRDGVWAVFEYAEAKRDLALFAYSCVYGPWHHPVDRIIMEDFNDLLEQLRLLVERAAQSGVVDQSRAGEAVRALRGMVDIYTSDYLLGVIDCLSREHAEMAVRGLLRGYGA